MIKMIIEFINEPRRLKKAPKFGTPNANIPAIIGNMDRRDAIVAERHLSETPLFLSFSVNNGSYELKHINPTTTEVLIKLAQ